MTRALSRARSNLLKVDSGGSSQEEKEETMEIDSPTKRGLHSEPPLESNTSCKKKKCSIC